MNRTCASIALALLPCAALAQKPELPKDALRDENFTIPTPGEFFAAVDKAAPTPWSQLLGTPPDVATESREQIALAIGSLVADGYVAVEAQDGQAVKNIGKEILSLAKKLNVSQSVLGRASSIGDFAEANDWNALREELEATQNEVKLDMAEQRDDRLVTLVTAAAWVRGIEIASGLVAGAYSPRSASLLHQPAVAEYLVEQLDALPEATRAHPSVAKIREGLAASALLVADPRPSEDKVNELHALARELRETFRPQPAARP